MRRTIRREFDSRDGIFVPFQFKWSHERELIQQPDDDRWILSFFTSCQEVSLFGDREAGKRSFPAIQREMLHLTVCSKVEERNEAANEVRHHAIPDEDEWRTAAIFVEPNYMVHTERLDLKHTVLVRDVMFCLHKVETKSEKNYKRRRGGTERLLR